MKQRPRFYKMLVAAVVSMILIASVAPVALADDTTSPPSTDSSLTALASTQPLSPAFDPATLTYTVLLPAAVDSVTLTPTAAAGAAFLFDNDTTPEPGHTYTLSAVNTSVTSKIVVTAQDGATQTTYTVDITRVGPARLLSMGISAGTLSPAFDPAKFGTRANPYVLTLPEGTAKVTFTPVSSNPADRIFANGVRVRNASFSITVLNGASKRLNITLLSPAGISHTYAFVVTRAKSTDADLKKLRVNVATGLVPAFSSSVTDYTVVVPANRASVVVTAMPAGPGAKVTINGKKGPARNVKLQNGATTDVSVIVTPQDTSAPAKTYTIHFVQTLRIDRFYASPRVLKLSSGKPVTFYYKLDGASDSTALDIKVGGTWQPLMAPRADAAGLQSFQWDGTMNGSPVAAGTYQVRLSASWNGLDAAPRIITVAVK